MVERYVIESKAIQRVKSNLCFEISTNSTGIEQSRINVSQMTNMTNKARSPRS